MSTALPVQRRFTVGEYDTMYEAGIIGPGERVELIEGRIFEKAEVNPPHFAAVVACSEQLLVPLVGRATVAIQSAIVLGDLNKAEPDVVVARHREDRYRSRLPHADDLLLLVEVADSSLYVDREVKAPLYARFAVPELWIVDLRDPAVEVYREPAASGFRSVERVGPAGVVAPLAFPDVEVTIATILGTS